MAEFADYYKKEIRTLREVGQEFGKAFPEIAARLNLSAQADADPTIERLFEGFAFLTAKIQQRIDDGLPELTTTLIEEIEPCLARPVPPMTMLEFVPRPGMLMAPKVLGTETKFKALGKQSDRPAWFSLSHPATIYPIEIAKIEPLTTPGKNELSIVIKKKSPLAKFVFPSSLDFVFGKDEQVAWSLLYCLCARLDRIALSCDGVDLPSSSKTSIQVLGTGADDSLLPEDAGSLPSARNIREYFCFEEKCLGVRLSGIPEVSESWQELRVRFMVDSSAPLSRIQFLETSPILLNCVPAINLFEKDADPVLLDEGTLTYPVVVDPAQRDEVFRITNVRVGNAKGAGSMTLLPFGLKVSSGVDSLRYHTHFSLGLNGQGLVKISIPTTQLRAKAMDVLSVRALCFQGQEVRERVQIGDVTQAQAGFPESIQFRNISRPSAPVPMIASAESQQTFLTLFQSNYFALATRENLVSMLELLASGVRSGGAKLIQSIDAVTVTSQRVLLLGSLVPIIQIEVVAKDARISSQSYAELGRYRVLSNLIFHLFEDSAPLNTLVRLRFKIEPSGEVFSFENAPDGQI